MKKEDLRKTINKSIEEQKNIIESTNSISYAAREILGTDSTLARTIIKDICEEHDWDVPTWYNRVKYCLNCGKPIVGGDYTRKQAAIFVLKTVTVWFRGFESHTFFEGWQSG